MSKKVTGFIRVVLIFGLTGVLLYLSLNSLQVEEGQTRWGFIADVWNNANKPYLLLSAIVTVLSHWFRSERWKQLSEPLGYKLKSTHSFFSVMIGYFVNLAIPRGGEISRSYNIYKLSGMPLDQSFGTVVAERVIDLFFLLTLITISFFIELDQLLYFFSQLPLGESGETNSISIWLVVLVVVLPLLGLLAIWIFRRMFRIRFIRFYSKIRQLLVGLKKGMTVVFKVENKPLFIFRSLGIWVSYFLMSYFIILAFPETNHLTLLDSLTIFVIGGIAMAIPLPGGTGSYHVLVPLGLVLLYNIQQKEAIAFSFIFHGWQTLLIILLGSLSFLGSQYYIRKRKNELKG